MTEDKKEPRRARNGNGPLPKGKKGGQKGKKRATNEELQERYEFVADLILKYKNFGQIKRAVWDKYKVRGDSANRYVIRAREIIAAERAEGTLPFHRARAIATYEGVLESETTTVREKLAARQRLDKIEGVETAVKVRAVDKDDNDILSLGSAMAMIEAINDSFDDGEEASGGDE